MIVCSPTKDENGDLVMPAWISRHPGGRMLRDIHVGLDSSTPRWNDAIESST
jgi:hypothetical protein